jgi:hypothetical protein
MQETKVKHMRKQSTEASSDFLHPPYILVS